MGEHIKKNGLINNIEKYLELKEVVEKELLEFVCNLDSIVDNHEFNYIYDYEMMGYRDYRLDSMFDSGRSLILNYSYTDPYDDLSDDSKQLTIPYQWFHMEHKELVEELRKINEENYKREVKHSELEIRHLADQLGYELTKKEGEVND